MIQIENLSKKYGNKINNLNPNNMKKSLFTLLLIFNFFCLSAQENTSILKEEKEEYSFIDLEEIPIYPGCEDFERNKRMECFNSKVSKHLTATFKYPLKAFKKNIQGRVHVMFVINKGITFSGN